jgi:iron(III) transport system permease protein
MASLQAGQRLRRVFRQGKRRRVPIAVWLPAALVAIAVLLPLVYLFLRTFEMGDNAWRFLLSSRNLEIIWNSALLVVSVTASSAVLAVPLAWLTVRSDLPLKKFWSVATVLPLVIPSYIGAYLFVLFLGEKGTLQQWLSVFGIERLPGIYGFGGAWLVLTLLCFPYVVLSARAALWRLDPGLEQSARLLGHGPVKTFLKVTLPLLRPAILSGSLLVALYVLSDFGAVSFLNFKTFTWAIYLQYGTINRSLAAALSLVLVVLTVILLLLERRARGRSAYYRSDSRSSAPPNQIQLGNWRWPAFGFCVLAVGVSLILPISVLITWVINGLFSGEVFQSLWTLAWNSISASALAALAVVIAALPVAVLAVRYPSWWSTTVERLTYIGFALPGIALALALVFFAVRYAQPLYQSLPLLIFAYAVMFLPAAVGSIRTSLLQVNPNLEAAARGLGRHPLRVMAQIYVPLLKSGILAGGALVFLLAMKELPATLILGPTGFKTLATSVWSYISEGFYAQAALPSLLLVVVSSGSLAFILGRDERQS